MMKYCVRRCFQKHSSGLTAAPEPTADGAPAPWSWGSGTMAPGKQPGPGGSWRLQRVLGVLSAQRRWVCAPQPLAARQIAGHISRLKSLCDLFGRTCQRLAGFPQLMKGAKDV